VWDPLVGDPMIAEWKSKVFTAANYNNLGAARIKADYTDDTEVVFKMWADGVLVYSNNVYNEEVFRLPRGYRTDTYEFHVKATTRVKSIHLGETPLSLKEV
jgi:hypothetical protein